MNKDNITYRDLEKHYNHNLVIEKYGTLDKVMNISLVCKDCNELIINKINPENNEDNKWKS